MTHRKRSKKPEFAAPIVGEEMASAMESQIMEKVYKHRVCGCCHLAKDGIAADDDGDAVVLRCGKIASKNYEEVQLAGNFLPYKCSRCFAG